MFPSIVDYSLEVLLRNDCCLTKALLKSPFRELWDSYQRVLICYFTSSVILSRGQSQWSLLLPLERVLAQPFSPQLLHCRSLRHHTPQRPRWLLNSISAELKSCFYRSLAEHRRVVQNRGSQYRSWVGMCVHQYQMQGCEWDDNIWRCLRIVGRKSRGIGFEIYQVITGAFLGRMASCRTA